MAPPERRITGSDTSRPQRATPPPDVRVAIDQLESDDAATRMQARKRLTDAGPAALEALTTCLYHPLMRVRWEAAKTIEAIPHPLATPALVDALDDDEQDVRWVAGEALIAIGPPALPGLLAGIIRRSGSVEFCTSAHHVLHELCSPGSKPLLEPVLHALTVNEPAVFAPAAAWKALQAIAFEGLELDA